MSGDRDSHNAGMGRFTVPEMGGGGPQAAGGEDSLNEVDESPSDRTTDMYLVDGSGDKTTTAAATRRQRQDGDSNSDEEERKHQLSSDEEERKHQLISYYYLSIMSVFYYCLCCCFVSLFFILRRFFILHQFIILSVKFFYFWREPGRRRHFRVDASKSTTFSGRREKNVAYAQSVV